MTASEPATDASLLDGVGAESVYRDVDGVELHAVVAGDESDPLVVLLHGYPEFWYGWHRQIPRLVDAGYRVLAPDGRGYNLSDRPDGVRSYRIERLSDDVAGLIASEGRESAHVVGHDWGAAVAWDLALRRPDVVDRLGILNVPHPTVFEDRLTSDPKQMRKSWYMFFYQLPRLPEWYTRRNDYAAFVSAFRTAEPGTFPEETLDRYRASWEAAGSITGMINWYRALFRHGEDPPREQVPQPTLVLWGVEDPYLRPEMASESVDYCEDGRLERLPEATHWLNHERPETVADHIIDHLAGDAADSGDGEDPGETPDAAAE